MCLLCIKNLKKDFVTTAPPLWGRLDAIAVFHYAKVRAIQAVMRMVGGFQINTALSIIVGD